ncbi:MULTISPECIES: hypothetical protein [Calothrix]|uniref:DUF1254 domain-containing protein n=2 Tax=Calothrix TaxID=1186 RepID=A0ABR8AFS1_9CYAN|nr:MULTISPECIES: hypothetical protein [Calothrix]MBD2198158.1 hypothetical protein [Calothrix parietina FACHB-288]MBD2227324.1 hypothetical protein [Calothrix anomala FACHB-343]
MRYRGYWIWIAWLILVYTINFACSSAIKETQRQEILNPAIANTQIAQTKGKIIMANNCESIRQSIETRNFLGWRGLPAECTAQDLFTNIPTDLSDRPVRPLGSDFNQAIFVLLELPGYYRPMASFRHNQLIMFDAMNPDLAGGFAPLHQDLGEPATRLDWHYGTLSIPTGEWVYPERGITVFLNTTADKALHIAVYQPTTLSEYERNLRPHLQKQVRPLRVP